MSTSAAELELLLGAAVEQARRRTPLAVFDLHRHASRVAAAVSSVTCGLAVLELVLIYQGEEAAPDYQVQLRRVGSEAQPSDLGLYCVSPSGYPIQRWHGRPAWAAHPDQPREVYACVEELVEHFRWMASSLKSRLVVLVTLLLAQRDGLVSSGP